MVAIRKLEEIVKKWADVTPTRAPYYEAGVRSPLKDWATEAAAAEKAWETGVQNAITDKRFEAGVKRVGTAKWQRKTLELGVARWPDGVRKARDDYAAGYRPFYETIAALTLPMRGPKGDPRNIERVKVIADALHKKKLELRGKTVA